MDNRDSKNVVYRAICSGVAKWPWHWVECTPLVSGSHKLNSNILCMLQFGVDTQEHRSEIQERGEY